MGVKPHAAGACTKRAYATGPKIIVVRPLDSIQERGHKHVVECANEDYWDFHYTYQYHILHTTNEWTNLPTKSFIQRNVWINLFLRHRNLHFRALFFFFFEKYMLGPIDA